MKSKGDEMICKLSLLFLLLVSLPQLANAEITEKEGCELAVKIGAGTLTYGQIAVDDKVEVEKFRQANPKIWTECYERGVKFGLASDDDLDRARVAKDLALQ